MPKHFPARRLNRRAPSSELITETGGNRPLVYRFYDAHQEPLYIGMTHNPGTRIAAHRLRSRWWEQAEWIAVSVYEKWRQAEEAERAAIRAERPPFNKAGTRWRSSVTLRLDADPREVAKELHGIGRPEFIRELARLLAHREEFEFPEPPPLPVFPQVAHRHSE